MLNFQGNKKPGAIRTDKKAGDRGAGFPERVQVGPAEHFGPVSEEVRDDVRPGEGRAVFDQHGGRGVRQPRRGVVGPHPVPDRDRVLPAGAARRSRRETGVRRSVAGRLHRQTVRGLAGPDRERAVLARRPEERGQTVHFVAAETGPAALRVPADHGVVVEPEPRARPSETQEERRGVPKRRGVHTGDAGRQESAEHHRRPGTRAGAEKILG